MSTRIVLDPEETTGKSIAILGTNGSGKSGTTRRLAEERLRKNLPFAIIDIENEFATLKELGEVILAGPKTDYGSFQIDILLTNSGEFHEFARSCYEDKKSVVLLVGELDDDTRKIYLKAFIDGFFEAASNPKTAYDYRLFIEEVQEFIPQIGLAKSDPLRQSIIRFGKRGRKRKLSLVLVSQRPSNVDKDVLTQCHIFFLHFVTYSTDIDVYQNNLGVDNCADKMKTMSAGDVIFIFGRQYVEDKIIKPKTISPWDEGSVFSSEKFVQVENVQEIRDHVEREGKKDDGMTVVQTSFLNNLKSEVTQQQTDIQLLIDQNLLMEKEIESLNNRPVVTVKGEADQDVQELVRSLQQRLNIAEAEAVPFRYLFGIFKEHLNGATRTE